MDLFPAEAATFSFMEDVARQVFGRYGFGELRVPVLEKTELFQKSIGEDTDVVGKEMFTFPDRKGRSLTMRPEATAGVIRAFVESGGYQPGMIAKYFTFGPMFRYERPQKGRQRQFHQIDAEIVGAPEAQADAELILMLDSFLRGIGLDKPQCGTEFLGLPQVPPRLQAGPGGPFQPPCPWTSSATTAADARTPTPCACWTARFRPARLWSRMRPASPSTFATSAASISPRCARCWDEAWAGLRAQSPVGCAAWDYYQRTTFEVVSGDIGAQTAVSGGGRYDGLVGSLGGPDLPATGFACGMERPGSAAGDNRPAQAPDFYVAVVADKAANPALLLAQELREAGLRGEGVLRFGQHEEPLARGQPHRRSLGASFSERKRLSAAT